MTAYRLPDGRAKLMSNQRAHTDSLSPTIFSDGLTRTCSERGRRYFTDAQAVIAQTQCGKSGGESAGPAAPPRSRGWRVGRFLPYATIDHHAEIGDGNPGRVPPGRGGIVGHRHEGTRHPLRA